MGQVNLSGTNGNPHDGLHDQRVTLLLGAGAPAIQAKSAAPSPPKNPTQATTVSAGRISVITPHNAPFGVPTSFEQGQF